MAFTQDGAFWAQNAGADLSAKLHYLAHVDTDGDLVLAGDGEPVVGVIVEAAAENKPVTVQYMGIAKCITGAAVTAGVPVASDSAGKAVAATTGEEVFGIALQTAGAANEVISVLIDRGFVP